MKKTKIYKSTKFQPDIISEATDRLLSYIPEDMDISGSYKNTISDVSWSYDSEAEFFADYRQDISYASYSKNNYYSSASKVGYYQLELSFRYRPIPYFGINAACWTYRDIVEIEMKSRYHEICSLQKCLCEVYMGNPSLWKERTMKHC